MWLFHGYFALDVFIVLSPGQGVSVISSLVNFAGKFFGGRKFRKHLPGENHNHVSNVQNPVDIPLYWLFNRDSFNSLLQSPYNWVVQSPLYSK